MSVAPPKGFRGSRSSEFKPGQLAHNKKAIGAISIRHHAHDTPRAWIKVGEPNKWIPHAQYVWTVHYGPIPKGHVVHHKNTESLDDTLDNLILLTTKAHSKIHEPARVLARSLVGPLAEKTVVCRECQASYIGKRHHGLCPACADQHARKSKHAYSVKHPRGIPRSAQRVHRFYEGEIWLIQRLIASHLVSYRTIAKIFQTCHTAIRHHIPMH